MEISAMPIAQYYQTWVSTVEQDKSFRKLTIKIWAMPALSDLGVHCANCLLLFCQVGLHDGEQSLYANAHLKGNAN